MIKKYTYNGETYLAEYEVRNAIFKAEKTALPQEINAEDWKRFGVTYTEEDDPLPVPPSLAEEKTNALGRVDNATSAEILAGFDYEIEGEILHFSYDQFDQQNFADTANACLIAKMGDTTVPDAITWNAYKESGELVRLNVTRADFEGLYKAAIFTHKAAVMEKGGKRKAQVEAAKSVEAIQALMAEWGI